MDKHVTLVGILHIACGALGVLIALICFVAITGGGLLSGDYEAIYITSTVGTAVGVFILVLSVPGIIGGIFLLKRAEWARIFVLILSVIDLLNIPIGTAIGIYSLWVLLNDETVKLFRGQTATASGAPPQSA
ncbi:MAG: hypothetical protein V3U73_05765 [bacterium]